MPRPPFGHCLSVVVTGIHDGDTLTVRRRGKQGQVGLYEWNVRIRTFAGECWAPELNKPRERAAGLKALEYVRDKLHLLGAADVALWVPETDDDNLLRALTTLSRLVGVCYVGQIDVGQRLIDVGLAWRTKEELRAALYGEA